VEKEKKYIERRLMYSKQKNYESADAMYNLEVECNQIKKKIESIIKPEKK
jgi:hypothetical protein